MDTLEEQPSARLYRLDTDLSLHVLDEGIICSNGPCWSPDGTTLYFSDTWSGEIRVYDYDTATGHASGRRTFAPVDTSGGGAAGPRSMPKAACGRPWCTRASWCATPDGRVDRVIEMPVRKVTSVMFGGPGLDTLYVTSMGKPPLPFPGRRPVPWRAVCRQGLGVRGLPEQRFGA